MRVKDRTQRMITIVAGELQAKMGKNISADEAIWHVFQEWRPELAKRIEQSNGDESEKQQDRAN